MSQRWLIPALVLLLAGLAGWAVAQPGPGGPKKGDGPPRFAVAATGSSAVLLETATGKTWVLNQALDGSSVWLPVRRLDTEEEVHQWMKAERARSAERDALQREFLNKLEKKSGLK
jgi:hypothetical protein